MSVYDTMATDIGVIWSVSLYVIVVGSVVVADMMSVEPYVVNFET